jgi:hypothetical protein
MLRLIPQNFLHVLSDISFEFNDSDSHKYWLKLCHYIFYYLFQKLLVQYWSGNGAEGIRNV